MALPDARDVLYSVDNKPMILPFKYRVFPSVIEESELHGGYFAPQNGLLGIIESVAQSAKVELSFVPSGTPLEVGWIALLRPRFGGTEYRVHLGKFAIEYWRNQLDAVQVLRGQLQGTGLL